MATINISGGGTSLLMAEQMTDVTKDESEEPTDVYSKGLLTDALNANPYDRTIEGNQTVAMIA